MTKKLVSFDDQAEPGEGLPAAVKAELNNTYADKSETQAAMEGKAPGLDASAFGVAADGTDCTAALSSAMAEAAARKIPLDLPDGTIWARRVRIPNFCTLRGRGSQSTILRQLDGQNQHFVTALSMWTNTSGAVSDTAIQTDAPLVSGTPAAPTLVVETTGGYLAAGDYSYRVAFARYREFELTGETLASAPATVTVTAPDSTVTVSTTPPRWAEAVLIFGRTNTSPTSAAANEKLIATLNVADPSLVTQPALSWTDNGRAVPNLGLPHDTRAPGSAGTGTGDFSASRCVTQGQSVALVGLTIDGNREGQTANAQVNAIYFNHVAGLITSDVKATNSPKHGIECRFLSAPTVSVTATENWYTGVMCYQSVVDGTFPVVIAYNNGVAGNGAGSGFVLDHSCSRNVVGSVHARSNSLDGVNISEGSSNNLLGSVLASYNGANGVIVADGQSGRPTSGNVVKCVAVSNGTAGGRLVGSSGGEFSIITNGSPGAGVELAAGVGQATTGNTVNYVSRHCMGYGALMRQVSGNTINGRSLECAAAGVRMEAASDNTVNAEALDIGGIGSYGNPQGFWLVNGSVNNVFNSPSARNTRAGFGAKYAFNFDSTSTGNWVRNLRATGMATGTFVESVGGTNWFQWDTPSLPAAPTTGAWRRGDRVFNSAPVAGGTAGWVCVAAGSPGTWKSIGTIGA